jgi:hypothetical protein
MAYIYRASFDLPKEQLPSLTIGAPLERAIGYLRTRLPGSPGFLTARAMQSLGERDTVEVALESVWQEWEDLVAHRDSDLLESKILAEFGDLVPREAIRVNVYQDVP